MDEQMRFWPFAAGESTLPCYLREIRGFSILGPQDEYTLAKRWSEHGDRDAATHTRDESFAPRCRYWRQADGRDWRACTEPIHLWCQCAVLNHGAAAFSPVI